MRGSYVRVCGCVDTPFSGAREFNRLLPRKKMRITVLFVIKYSEIVTMEMDFVSVSSSD